MDSYSEPAFLTSRTQWFQIARPDGRLTTVIAVSSEESKYWIVAYGILVGMNFAAIAKLATSLVLASFPLGGSGNLCAMLVSFCNANSPTTAIIQIAQYIRHVLFPYRRRNGRAVDWPTVRSGLCLVFLSLSMVGSWATAKFLVSGNTLIVRRAARVKIFYPSPACPGSLDQFVEVQSVRTAAALQAVSRVSTAKEMMSEGVHTSFTITNTTDGPSLSFRWDYSLTGMDMGLLEAPNLKYSVSGQCDTRYNWLDTTQPNRDIYLNFGDRMLADEANFDEGDRPPWVSVFPRSRALALSKTNHGYEFSMTPKTVYRASSYSNPDDIWYMTEENPGFSNETGLVVWPYRVRRGRPSLHCWQNDTWSMNGITVYSVDNLKDIPGLQLSTFLRDTVFPREFAVPPIVPISNHLGYAALESSTYVSPNEGYISAQFASAAGDLGRLAGVSFVWSREVVRDLLSVSSLFAVQTIVPIEAAEFIAESPNVAALSVLTLVTTPSVCVLLWLIVLICGKMGYGRAKAPNYRVVSRYHLSTTTLAPRYYEEVSSNGRPKWSRRTSMTPFIKVLPEPDDTNDQSCSFIQPKLVRLNDDDSVQDENAQQTTNEKDHVASFTQSQGDQPERSFWSKLMFWKMPETPKAHRYEIAMTRQWIPTEGRQRGKHLKDL